MHPLEMYFIDQKLWVTCIRWGAMDSGRLFISAFSFYYGKAIGFRAVSALQLG
jgi:hypothetical protein